MSTLAGLWVAAATIAPFAHQPPDPSQVKPGWLGLGVVVALAVAVTLLWLSFRKQLKKIDFEEEPADPSERRTRSAGRQNAPWR
jgi:hypothetical protein